MTTSWNENKNTLLSKCDFKQNYTFTFYRNWFVEDSVDKSTRYSSCEHLGRSAQQTMTVNNHKHRTCETPGILFYSRCQKRPSERSIRFLRAKRGVKAIFCLWPSLRNSPAVARSTGVFSGFHRQFGLKCPAHEMCTRTSKVQVVRFRCDTTQHDSQTRHNHYDTGAAKDVQRDHDNLAPNRAKSRTNQHMVKDRRYFFGGFVPLTF